MPPIFGLPQYKEIDHLTKLLKKAKTNYDKKRFQRQIDYLRGEIRNEEKETEEYFEEK